MAAWRSFLFAVLVAFGVSSARADIGGQVTAVTDGDTVKVLDANLQQHRIRLSGIDAPEKGQPFGGASRRHLVSLLAGKKVRVETSKTDRYGRVLGKIWVQPPDCAGCGQTLDANLAQIKAGMAWWYEYYASEQPPQDRETYKVAVGEAKRNRLGLWRDADAIPPWAWRRGQRIPTAQRSRPDFECGRKRFCSEMASCDEAQFFLRRCGLLSLDRDRNGVPCESLCGIP